MASARDPITYEQVVAAIANISAAGDKLTLRRLQSEVGGSNTTVLAHLRRWQETQRAAEKLGPEDGFMPTHLRAAMAAWVQDREAAARQNADNRAAQADELYQAAKEGWEQAETRIEVLQKAVADGEQAAVEQQQALSELLAAQQARNEQADKQIAELKEQVAREQHNAETSRVSAAEARIKADAAQDSIKTLGKANEELRSDARTQTEAAGDARQRAAVAEERAKNRDEQLVEMRAVAAKSAASAEDLQRRLHEAEKRLSAAERDLAVCREQHRSGGGGGQGGGGPGPNGGEHRGGRPHSQPEQGQDSGKRQAAPADGGQDAGTFETHGHREPPRQETRPEEGQPQQVNVTMRKLGKPATQQEVSRSMQALMTGAPKLGHQLYRGEAPKTNPRPADGAASPETRARP